MCDLFEPLRPTLNDGAPRRPAEGPLAGPRRRIDLRPKRTCELDGERSDAARATVDEDAHAGRDARLLHERLPGRQSRERQRGRLHVSRRDGLPGEIPGAQRDVFGSRAINGRTR